VGENAAGDVVGAEPGPTGAELPFYHRESQTLTALFLRLAHAEERHEPVSERRRHLAVDLLVSLAEYVAALGVSEEHISATQLDEHARSDLPGEGAPVLPVAVLSAPPDGRAGEHFRHRGQRRVGWAHRHLHATRTLEPFPYRGGEGAGLGDRAVHLPVAHHEGRPHHGASSRAATPGSTRPSRNSRKAPPAVEM